MWIVKLCEWHCSWQEGTFHHFFKYLATHDWNPKIEMEFKGDWVRFEFISNINSKAPIYFENTYHYLSFSIHFESHVKLTIHSLLSQTLFVLKIFRLFINWFNLNFKTCLPYFCIFYLFVRAQQNLNSKPISQHRQLKYECWWIVEMKSFVPYDFRIIFHPHLQWNVHRKLETVNCERSSKMILWIFVKTCANAEHYSFRSVSPFFKMFEVRTIFPNVSISFNAWNI